MHMGMYLFTYGRGGEFARTFLLSQSVRYNVHTWRFLSYPVIVTYLPTETERRKVRIRSLWLYPLFRPSGSPRNSSNFPFFPRWRSEFPFSLSRYLGPKGRRPIVRTPEIFIGDARNVSADYWFF